METQKGRRPWRAGTVAVFSFVFSLFLFVGCGAPGEPSPPSPPVPVAVTDLSARQQGEAVQLKFTLPTKTITGDRLSEPPAVEILRGALRPDGLPDDKSFRVVQTIPGALVDNYRAEDEVEFVDAVPADELRSLPGQALVYRVRTRASRRRASTGSNMVAIRLLPVAERITTLRASPSEAAIELTWEAPARSSDGQPLGAISEYRVYRGQIDPSSAEQAAKDLSQVRWKAAPTLLDHASTNSYRDASFEFGQTYVYTVRTVIAADGKVVESSDSAPAVITPKDIYPPGVPAGLVAAVIAGESGRAAEVDVSWSISPETDLAGYRVYRSEQQETKGELATPDVLLSPAYRDTSVRAGQRYWYRVTAVDRAGNESAPSAPVLADLTQPSP